jgi:hypothetical protein
MTHELAALVAVCDVISPSQRYEQLRRDGWFPSAATAEVRQLEGTVYFSVQEFGIQRSGVAIALRRRIEWGSRSNSSDPNDQWRHISVESMHRQVLNVVIPDDAEESGDDHPWSEFLDALRSAKIFVSEEQLRQLSYNVVFAPRLYDILTGATSGEDIAFNDLIALQRGES